MGIIWKLECAGLRDESEMSKWRLSGRLLFHKFSKLKEEAGDVLEQEAWSRRRGHVRGCRTLVGYGAEAEELKN